MRTTLLRQAVGTYPLYNAIRDPISLEADSKSSLEYTNAAVRNVFLTMAVLVLVGCADLQRTMMFLLLAGKVL